MNGAPLPRRTLGSAGLSVSAVGLGLAAIGRPGYINLGRAEDLGAERDVATMERRCHRVLDAAFDAGIRYVDAARSYGLAEAFLASWLERRGLAPGALSVGSKWGYRYVGDWRLDAPVQEVKDHSLSMFTRQWDESRALLDGYLGLYQVHSATLESGVLEDPSVLGALAGLGRSGVAVGLSVSGPRQSEVVRRALEVEVDGTSPFDAVQATWNPLEPSVGPALAEAHREGWGVLVKEALANGRLTGRGDAKVVSVLGPIAADHGVGVDAVALAVALAQPFADVVLSGAASTEQLASNLGALEVDLSAEERAAIARLAEGPEDYWRHRATLPWL